MFFPRPKKWTGSNPLDPARRIDQELSDRRRRLAIGLSISEDLGSVQGSMILTEGHGKYLRLRHTVSESLELPETVRDTCQQISQSEQPDFQATLLAKSDLSEALCPIIESLKQNAGKYVDRLLFVAVHDPGMWFDDFDGQRTFSNWIDPICLAETTGITTLDAFPARDMAAGGNGQHLYCLPNWLMMADRSKTVSDQARLFMSIQGKSKVVFLPPSDGLEAEIPRIQVVETLGLEFLTKVLEFFGLGQLQESTEQLNIQGQAIPELLAAWKSLQSSAPFNQIEDYLDCCQSWQTNPFSAADLVRTSLVFLVEMLHLTAARMVDPATISHVIIETPDELAASLVNQLDRTFASATAGLVDQFGLENGRVQAAGTAVLGMLHIDQMPANIPWLSNADSQRILGRLTPGRPTNWRQVLREMADFQPPAMRLRDAV
ncbi:MAG: anhydro-N-acetylmuramic acid kinase [Mariniblastus sp.]|nr:anhydro-N-acetylmuramic acid kinase [Mariniblastus sp.]